MTEYWERTYPYPLAPYDRSVGLWNRQMLLDLGNGWTASLITELDWSSTRVNDTSMQTPWAHIPGEVEVGFLTATGLRAVSLEYDSDGYITGAHLPSGVHDSYTRDSVVRHVTVDYDLDPLLAALAALPRPEGSSL